MEETDFDFGYTINENGEIIENEVYHWWNMWSVGYEYIFRE